VEGALHVICCPAYRRELASAQEKARGSGLKVSRELRNEYGALITPVTIVIIVMMMMIVMMVMMVMMVIVMMVMMVMMVIVMMIIVAIASAAAMLIARVAARFGFGQDQLCGFTESWCHYFSTIPDERKGGQHKNDRACQKNKC
jgi:uncharacterized membrane protein